MNIVSSSRRLVRDTRGANLVEYILLVGFIAIICIVAFTKFGNSVQGVTNTQADAVKAIPNAASAGK